MAEQGVGLRGAQLDGPFRPARHAAAVVERLGEECGSMQAPAVRGRLNDLASEPIWMPPARTDAFVREEFARWEPVVRAAGISTEG